MYNPCCETEIGYRTLNFVTFGQRKIRLEILQNLPSDLQLALYEKNKLPTEKCTIEVIQITNSHRYSRHVKMLPRDVCATGLSLSVCPFVRHEPNL